MPHLLLSLSANALEGRDLGALVRRGVDLVCGLPTVGSESVKGYGHVYESWAMGAGAPEGFVHVTFAVLAGRADTVRSDFGDALFRWLHQEFADAIRENRVGVTVEIREMDPISYRKGGL